MMLYTMLTERAGWTLNSFDRGTCDRTRDDYTVLGYPAYWVFQQQQSIREWLFEILPHYHSDFTESGNGQLSVILDRTLTTLPVIPDYHIPFYEVDDQGSPATAVALEMQAEDVVNRVVLKGRYNWSANETTAEYGWDYLQSQNAYQGEYPAEFSFRGMYTLAHATQWLHSHAIRHGFDPTVVSFTLTGLKGLPLIPPRIVTMEWPPYQWSEHLLKIRRTAISFRNHRVSYEAIDCQRELADTLDDPSTSPTMRLRQLSRIYQFIPGTVGDRGQLTIAPQNTRNEAANGDFELGDTGQWDWKPSSAANQWMIVENASEAYHGRFYVQHVPLSGNGTAMGLWTRIDPDEWVLVSAWFRQHSSTNGLARAAVSFYDQDYTEMTVVTGNSVTPTTGYMESVCTAQAPAGAYYYRPAIGFATYPSTGIWRCDHVFSVSGTLNDLVAARPGNPVTRNFILNGDFEGGTLMFDTEGTWQITNEPFVAARSGLWKAVHGPTFGPNEERLTSLTKVAVTVGQVFTLQAQAITLSSPNGTGRLGVTWLNGQGVPISENATTPGTGPFFAYTVVSGSMVVPTGAAYATVWAGISGHTFGGTWWCLDDIFISIG